MPVDEYFIQKLGENIWRIYKVNDLHFKLPSATYEVKKLLGVYHCDCPAPKYCKHMDMVKEYEKPKPKKDLF